MNINVKELKEKDDVKLLLRVCSVLLCGFIAGVLLAAVYLIISHDYRNITELLQIWDAKRYWYIVEHGYTYPNDFSGQANWAFFPVYVLTCMAVKFVTFGLLDTYLIGTMVSAVCIIIAAFFGSKLVEDKTKGMILSALLLVGPYCFYYVSMMTEAMFIMFIVLFFYSCKRKKYLLAGLMSAFASGTRIVGCLLVIPLIMELYMEISHNLKFKEGIKKFVITMLKTPKYILSVLLCPLGIFSYMLFLYFFCGDAWAFKSVQIAWRTVDVVPIFGVLWNACTNGFGYDYYVFMGWMSLVFIGIYIYMFKKKRYSMAVFGLITILVPLTSHVMSICRMTMGTFVIYIGFTDILYGLKDKSVWTKVCAITLVATASVALLLLWFDSSAWVM